MSDLIDRQAAIDYINRAIPNWSEDKETALDCLNNMPSEHRKMDEWCTDCKEYDQERHCCPRFNRVIRETLDEVKPQMSDLISRQAAIEAIDEYIEKNRRPDFIGNLIWVSGVADAMRIVSDLPSVQERKGRWIIAETEPEFIACSACIDKSRATGGKIQIWRKAVRSQLNYCPRCGAHMGGEQDDND